MDNVNTQRENEIAEKEAVLILVLMDNVNTFVPEKIFIRDTVLILVLMDNVNTVVVPQGNYEALMS